MSKLSEQDKKAYGRIITQRMPRGRLRLNPDVVPEIACWLLVHGLRYEKQRDATLKMPHYSEHKYAKRTVEVMEYFLTGVQHMIDHLTDTVGLAEWHETWMQIATDCGLPINPLTHDHYAGTDEMTEAEKAE